MEVGLAARDVAGVEPAGLDREVRGPGDAQRRDVAEEDDVRVDPPRVEPRLEHREHRDGLQDRDAPEAPALDVAPRRDLRLVLDGERRGRDAVRGEVARRGPGEREDEDLGAPAPPRRVRLATTGSREDTARSKGRTSSSGNDAPCSARGRRGARWPWTRRGPRGLSSPRLARNPTADVGQDSLQKDECVCERIDASGFFFFARPGRRRDARRDLSLIHI